MHFLLNHRFHSICHLVGERVHEFSLRLLLGFGQRTHRHELRNVPAVGLSQLLELDAHHFLVDYVDEQVAQALVQLDAESVRKARPLHSFLLGLSEPTVNPDFLRLEIKRTQPPGQLCIHFIILQFGVFEHVHRELVLSRLENTLRVEPRVDHLQNSFLFIYFLAHIAPVLPRRLTFIFYIACSRRH